VMRVDPIVFQGDTHIANRPEASGQGIAQAGIVLHVPTTVVILRLDTREIVGFEALCRMTTPSGEIIAAAHFHEATKDA
ncbi:hypothetical protein ACCS53_39335, partial [Rhizobium ruizarguesonis]